MTVRVFLRHWVYAVGLMVGIYAISSIPSAELPNFGWVDLLIKKGGHALGYALLAVGYLNGLIEADQGRINLRLLFSAWVMAVFYSATDEFHQSFVPGRHPSVFDVVIDASGAALALRLVSMVTNKKPADIAGH